MLELGTIKSLLLLLLFFIIAIASVNYCCCFNNVSNVLLNFVFFSKASNCLWIVSCLLASLFPLLPTVGLASNYLLV